MAKPLSPTEYRLLTEHSPSMVWRAGRDASCDYFNGTWLAFTGRTLEQELGPGWTDGVHHLDYKRCMSTFLDNFHRREAFEMEYRLRRHDGTYRWIFDRGAPFTDDHGNFAGYIGSCLDIDDRRRGEDSLFQRNEEQMELARDFQKWTLAIVSHDIRNPLHSIHMASRGLQKGADSNSTQKKLADIVARGADRIQHLVADLLDLARENEGAGIPIRLTEINLCVTCQQVIDELEGSAPDRKITLECLVDAQGAWDEHRILQAVSNLTSNAIQHGTPGGSIRIRVTGDEHLLAIEIHNEGAIPESIVPHLFEPFRTQREGHRSSGLGLGLFIARAIAQAHGGKLEIASTLGYTTSRFTLPRNATALSS